MRTTEVVKKHLPDTAITIVALFALYHVSQSAFEWLKAEKELVKNKSDLPPKTPASERADYDLLRQIQQQLYPHLAIQHEPIHITRDDKENPVYFHGKTETLSDFALWDARLPRDKSPITIIESKAGDNGSKQRSVADNGLPSGQFSYIVSNNHKRRSLKGKSAKKVASTLLHPTLITQLESEI